MLHICKKRDQPEQEVVKFPCALTILIHETVSHVRNVPELGQMQQIPHVEFPAPLLMRDRNMVVKARTFLVSLVLFDPRPTIVPDSAVVGLWTITHPTGTSPSFKPFSACTTHDQHRANNI